MYSLIIKIIYRTIGEFWLSSISNLSAEIWPFGRIRGNKVLVTLLISLQCLSSTGMAQQKKQPNASQIQKMIAEKRGGGTVIPASPSMQVLLTCGDHEHKDGLTTVDVNEEDLNF